MSIRFSIVAVVLAVAVTACAQPTPPPMGGPDAGRAPAMESRSRPGPNRAEAAAPNFFPPELVMSHQRDLNLTPDQETALREEAVKLAAKSTDLRWQQIAEQAKLETLLKQPKPDEKAILDQQEKVLKIQDDLKLSHLTALIRIKNTLTPEQQTKLTELQKRAERQPLARPMMQRGEMGFRPGFGHGFGRGMPSAWGGRMMQRGEMGFHPGDGRGPGFRPGMGGGEFPGRAPMQGGGMNFRVVPPPGSPANPQ